MARQSTRGNATVALMIMCMLATAATNAHAALITFNSLAASFNEQRTTLTTDGYTFTGQHFHIINSPAGTSFGGSVQNGTIYIAEEAGPDGKPISMGESTAKAFTFFAFDGAELWLSDSAAASGGFPNADFIDIVGNVSGGGTMNASFPLDHIKDGAGGAPDFQTFVLPPTFTNLTSVTFSGSRIGSGTGAISLDNINVDVPEPAGAVAIAIACGVGAVASRRRAQPPLNPTLLEVASVNQS